MYCIPILLDCLVAYLLVYFIIRSSRLQFATIDFTFMRFAHKSNKTKSQNTDFVLYYSLKKIFCNYPYFLFGVSLII